MMERVQGVACTYCTTSQSGDLPCAALAAQLPHRLDVERPALHVGVGQMSAIGVGRQLAAEPQRAALDERPASPRGQ